MHSGSGSNKAKSYGSCCSGSGSTTQHKPLIFIIKFCNNSCKTDCLFYGTKNKWKLCGTATTGTRFRNTAASNQCSGSGTGSRSKCFLAIRIRIHLSEVWIRIRLRILLSSCKNSKKNLDSFYFVTLYL
jgi:hypothetical protein